MVRSVSWVVPRTTATLIAVEIGTVLICTVSSPPRPPDGRHRATEEVDGLGAVGRIDSVEMTMSALLVMQPRDARRPGGVGFDDSSCHTPEILASSRARSSQSRSEDRVVGHANGGIET